MENLPKDIFADILSRLTVKHLHRFKCVSHAWYDLISDHYFIKLHQVSRKDGSKQHVVYSRIPNDLHSADFDSFEEEAVLGYPPLHPYHEGGAVVVGSCDGLVCLCELGRYNTRFVLYNPTTQFYNILPWTPFEVKFESQGMLYYGFGYDSTSGNYKVMRIAQTSEDPSDYFLCDARVYSLSTNSWKKVADVPYCLFRLHMFGIYLNDALHFLASEIPEQGVPDKIVGFNLGHENYYSLPQPTSMKSPEPGEKRHLLTIGVLDGCLCQVDNYHWDNQLYDVWIMKEYGVQKSWSKFYQISLREPVPFFDIGRDGEPMAALLRPISFLRNRKELFFMVCFSFLASYDLEKKTLKRILHPINRDVTWDMFIYDETLPSPHSGIVDGISLNKEEQIALIDDVIIDILLRLPVKTLGRFKSVSYRWYDLISDPCFVSRQVDWSRKTSSKLHIVYNEHSLPFRRANFDSFDEDTSLTHPFLGRHHSTVVVGASDGLLCLCDMSFNHLTFPFALYNPTTGSSNILPDPFLESFVSYDHFMGFGYDGTNDDYKIVKIAQPKHKKDCLQQHAQVYSLNTNSWKRVTNVPFRLTEFFFAGVCVNGVVHWIASSDSDKELHDAIVGFDIVNEKYSMIPQPLSVEPYSEHFGNRCFLAISILDGCLTQVRNHPDEHFHDVWVMEEYGVQSSWRKLFRVVNEVPDPLILRPVTFSKNRREFFFLTTYDLLSYDLEEKKLRKCDFPSVICWNVHVYEETLVSAEAGNANQD